MEQTNMVNGINMNDFTGTIEAIKDQPVLAKFKFRANNEWINAGHTRTEIKDFYGTCEDIKHTNSFTLDADEPPVLLSGDKGPNPVEYALTGLAGCLMTSLVYHAAAKGIQLEEVEAILEGDLDIHGLLGLDESVRNGYEQVRVTFKVKGDMSEEMKEELVQIAQSRSPVFDIFTNKVPVSVQLEKESSVASSITG
jgi:uncharacterized OsmC-like protein